MLYQLTVKGFGIIERIAWQPAAGLNVITGETGAGKSLVVDAVEALLSGRVQEDDIRHGTDEACIEGVFKVPRGALRGLLAGKGLEADEDSLVISGDFRRQGRATPRVNRQVVSRALLQGIGAALVDIHGQSEHLSLLHEEQHLDFLDAYARTRDLRREFAARAAELHQAEREIQALSRSEQDLARQKELLGFQTEEIRRAALRAGEDGELETELARLVAAEKLKAASYEIYSIIYGDESISASPSAVDRVGEALSALRQVVETDPSMKDKLGYLEEVLHGLEEMAREVRAYGDSLNHDPR